MKYTPQNLEETQKIAADFALALVPDPNSAKVIGLYGNLGAGKTSFTQAFAKALGVEEVVTSPTFVIEKIYDLAGQKFTRLIHIDAYRLEKSEELLKLGWKEVISDRDNIVIIEWPDRVSDIMPPHTKIALVAMDTGESREVEIDD